MRRALAPALVLLLLVAGCVATNKPLTYTRDCGLGPASRAVNASWAQDCAARASSTAGPKEEIWLAINPTDSKNIVLGAKDLNPESSQKCVWNGVFVTHDAGVTWKDVVIGGKFRDRQPSDPWFGYACNTDPMFAFTRDGALHYGVELYNFLGKDAFGQFGGTPLQGDEAEKTPGWKILLATSKDGGDTWPTVITYAPDSGPIVDDYSRMTIVPTTQTILEAINLASPAGNTVNVLSSRDGGKTADPPVEVTLKAAPGMAGVLSIASSLKGVVVLGVSSPTGASFMRSTDDGRTFPDENAGFPIKAIPGQFSESKYRTGTNFEMAFAPDGKLYAIFADSTRDEADIYVRGSADNGKTWTEPVMVNNDTAGAHQFIPNLAIAADGTLHAFFMDKRYDPEHKLIDITHATSNDGGKTWKNERVTKKSFDGDLGVHQRGFPFIGDYIGAAAMGADVWVGYPDSSDGNTAVVAAAHVVGR